MAMDWLDGARYADTNGYQNDFARTMWPWRDWVIAAFNANQPFDRVHDRPDRGRPPARRPAWPSGSQPASIATTARSPRPARSTRSGASRTPWTGSRRPRWSSSASRWAVPDATTTSSTRSRRPSSTSSSASSTASTRRASIPRRGATCPRWSSCRRPEDPRRLREFDLAIAVAKAYGTKEHAEKLGKAKAEYEKTHPLGDGDGGHGDTSPDVRAQARPV